MPGSTVTQIEELPWGIRANVVDGDHYERCHFPYAHFPMTGEKEARMRAHLWIDKTTREIEAKKRLRWRFLTRKRRNMAPHTYARGKPTTTLICRLKAPDGSAHNFQHQITNDNLIHACEQMGIFFHYTIKMWDPELASLYSPTKYRDELLKSILQYEDYQRALTMIYGDKLQLVEP